MPDKGLTILPFDQFKRKIWREYKSGKISYKQYMLSLRTRMKVESEIAKNNLSKVINHERNN